MKIWRIVFFGTDDFSAPILRELLKMPEIKVVAVVTKSDSRKSRGSKIESPEVAKIAREFNSRNQRDSSARDKSLAQNDKSIKIFQPIKLREIEPELRELKPDAGVLVAYGKIIPQSTINIFEKEFGDNLDYATPGRMTNLSENSRDSSLTVQNDDVQVSRVEHKICSRLAEENSREGSLDCARGDSCNVSRKAGVGIINFHPSHLPKLRGPSPIETVILNGERETGLSLMKLAKEMDAGPILYQEKISLSGRETAPELYEKFAGRGVKLFREKLVGILNGDYPAVSQNDSEATYCHLIAKTDGEINPRNETAEEIERKIRAFLAWPKTRIREEFLFAKKDVSRTDNRTDLSGDCDGGSEDSRKDSSATSEKSSGPRFSGMEGGDDSRKNTGGDREIIVTRAKVLTNFAGENWPDVLKCAKETYLQIQEIISPKSGKRMGFGEYLRGITGSLRKKVSRS